MIKRLLLSLYFLLAFSIESIKAQNDSSVFIPMFDVGYSVQFPQKDLNSRFGISSAIGSDMLFKTSSNFIYGIDGYFIFGSDVKESGILDSLRTSEGYVIDRTGLFAQNRMYQRGFTFSGKIGYVFNHFSKNPNSGIMILAGAGYLQHKIRIEDVGNNSPQLSKEYRKGYDRMTGGPMFSEFIGYLFLSNKRYVNLFGGVEFMQGFTKSLRGFNYDTMQYDTANRKDFIMGLKVGAIIPFYKRVPDEYYYN